MATGSFKNENKMPSGTQSIRRTIMLIKEIAENNDAGLRLSQIARKVQLPNATVHRQLSALTSELLIDFDPVSKHYHLGIGLYSLGIKAEHFEIRNTCRYCLERISDQTRATVYLIVRSGFDALCIDLIEGKTPFRVVAYDIGSRTVLGFGAASLAFLSFSKDDEIETILKSNEKRYKKNHNITADKIRPLIRKTRRSGYVFSEGYHIKGMNAVGLPVLNDQRNVVAAISVGYLSDQLNLKMSKKIAALIKSEIEILKL